MENINNEFFIQLRQLLPGRYASLLFSRYKRENIQFSKSLILKVAHGECYNETILNDLLKMVEEREAFLQRLAKIEKRISRNRKVKSEMPAPPVIARNEAIHNKK